MRLRILGLLGRAVKGFVKAGKKRWGLVIDAGELLIIM